MTERRGTSRDACARGVEAVAFVQGESSPAEAASMLEHLAGCESCRELVADTRAILAQLGVDEVTVVTRRAPIRSSRMFAAASVLAVVLAVWVAQADVPWGERRALPAPRVERTALTPLSWVESTLGPDGTWYAFARTGPRAREPGLHAFGLLAMVRGSSPKVSAGRLDAIRDAATWLIEQQADDGSIGLPLASGQFDHPVATLALVEAAQISSDASIRSAAERALAHIVDQRSVLWRPGGQEGRAAWTLAALSRARQLGFSGLDEVIRRGRGALGPAAVDSLGGDMLAGESFWDLALGSAAPRPGGEPAEDLFSASLAVLAPARR